MDCLTITLKLEPVVLQARNIQTYSLLALQSLQCLLIGSEEKQGPMLKIALSFLYSETLCLVILQLHYLLDIYFIYIYFH